MKIKVYETIFHKVLEQAREIKNIVQFTHLLPFSSYRLEISHHYMAWTQSK